MPKRRASAGKWSALPLIFLLAASLQGEGNLFQPLLFPLHNNHSMGVLINFLYEVVKAVNREVGAKGSVARLKIDAGLQRPFQSSA